MDSRADSKMDGKDQPNTYGYDNLIKALRECDKETQDKVIEKLQKLI